MVVRVYVNWSLFIYLLTFISKNFHGFSTKTLFSFKHFRGLALKPIFCAWDMIKDNYMCNSIYLPWKLVEYLHLRPIMQTRHKVSVVVLPGWYHSSRAFFWYDTDYKMVLCCIHRFYFIVGVMPKKSLKLTGASQAFFLL